MAFQGQKLKELSVAGVGEEPECTGLLLPTKIYCKSHASGSRVDAKEREKRDEDGLQAALLVRRTAGQDSPSVGGIYEPKREDFPTTILRLYMPLCMLGAARSSRSAQISA